MIERFNFFDIFAYLLPGLTFLGLVWLPFGVVAGKWPPADWSSALLLLVAAYIVGHVLYYPSSKALSTKARGFYPNEPVVRSDGQAPTTETENRPIQNAPNRSAELKHPSEYLLDARELTLPEKFKTELEKLINQQFKDAVKVTVSFDWNAQGANKKAESSQRALAFMLCRSALVAGKVASYGEQFEGLYQFLRCLTVVFLLGFTYHVGWALAMWSTCHRIKTFATIVAAVSLVFAMIVNLLAARGKTDRDKQTKKDNENEKGKKKDRDRDKEERQAAWLFIGPLMVTLFLCPFFIKSYVAPIRAGGGSLLVGVAFLDALVCARCFTAYKPFSVEFAKAIYRDFYVYAKDQGKAGTKAAE
jgi:uncharacterized membrane protein